MTASPNHALQRTPGFGVQLPGAAVVRPAQSRAVLPARVKGLRPHAAGAPGTARAFALRRRAHSRAPGPESLSLGSLGVATHIMQRIFLTLGFVLLLVAHTYSLPESKNIPV